MNNIFYDNNRDNSEEYEYNSIQDIEDAEWL